MFDIEDLFEITIEGAFSTLKEFKEYANTASSEDLFGVMQEGAFSDLNEFNKYLSEKKNQVVTPSDGVVDVTDSITETETIPGSLDSSEVIEEKYSSNYLTDLMGQVDDPNRPQKNSTSYNPYGLDIPILVDEDLPENPEARSKLENDFNIKRSIETGIIGKDIIDWALKGDKNSIKKLQEISTASPQEITAQIEAGDFNNPYSYEKYSELDTENLEQSTFNAMYGASDITSIDGFNANNFDGYMKEQGYYEEYLRLLNDETISEDGRTYDISGNYNPTLASERLKLQFLTNYVNNQIERNVESQVLNYKLDHNGKHPGLDGVQLSFSSGLDDQKLTSYIEEAFPVVTSKLKSQDVKNQELYQEYKKGENPWFAQSLKQGWRSVEDRINSFSAATYDWIGLDSVADEIRMNASETELDRDDFLRYTFASGKKAQVNGVEYLVDGKGQIYDVDSKIRVTNVLPKEEVDYIRGQVDLNGVKDWTYSQAGATVTTAGIAADMLLTQIPVTKLVGVLGVAAKSGLVLTGRGKNIVNLLEKVPIKATTASAMIAQGQLFSTNLYEQTRKQALDGGMSMEMVDELSGIAGRQGYVLGVVTAPLSTQTYAMNKIFGKGANDKLVKGAAAAYMKGGAKAATTFWKKAQQKVTNYGATYGREGLKETFQENVQQAGEVFVIGEDVNEVAGKKIMADTISGDEFMNTSILSLAAGALMPLGGDVSSSVKTAYNKRYRPGVAAIDRMELLHILSNDLKKTTSLLNSQVTKGLYTEEQVSDLLKDINIYRGTINSIPTNLTPETALSVMNNINEVNKQKKLKEQTDPAFHPAIDEKIAELRADIVKKTNFDYVSKKEKQKLKDEAGKQLVSEAGDSDIELDDSQITYRAIENFSKLTIEEQRAIAKIEIKTEENAIQEPSTESVDASESAGSSEAVGQGVSSNESTNKGKAESKTKDREKTEEKVGLVPNAPDTVGTAETYASDTMEVTMISKRPNGEPANTKKEGDVFEVRVSKLGSDGEMRTNNSMTQSFETAEKAKDYANKFIDKDTPTDTTQETSITDSKVGDTFISNRGEETVIKKTKGKTITQDNNETILPERQRKLGLKGTTKLMEQLFPEEMANNKPVPVINIYTNGKSIATGVLKTEGKVDQQESDDFEALLNPTSDVESDIDNIPTSKLELINGEVIDVHKKAPNLTFTKKGKNNNDNSELSIKVINQAQLAAKAVRKLFPSMKIIVHRDNEVYKTLDPDNDSGMYDPSTNTVHVNLSEANGRTIAHEIFHAVLLNKLKMNNDAAMKATKKMVQAILRSKTLDKSTRIELKKFLANYDSEIQNEEMLAEIVGMIADNYIKLDASSKTIVRKWIEKIASFLGIEMGQSEKDVVDLLNTIARKAKTGETITDSDLDLLSDFKGGKNVENPASALRKQAVGGFEVSYTENENIEEYIKDGRVTEPKNVSDFNGLQTVITSPDDMLAGEIKYKGKTIFEGEGGVFFVTKFGDVWASGKEGTANTIANGLNKQLKENDGRAFLTLTKGTDSKLVSSASGVNSTLAILDAMLDQGLITPSIFRSAVSTTVKKAGGEINLRQSAKDLKTDIKKFFTDPTTSTFEKRGFIVKDIVGEIAKNLSKENQVAIAEFLAGDTTRSVAKGTTTLKGGRPGSQALVDLIAKISAEGLTKGLNVGDVYAVIEINSEVEVSKDSHPSYPFHISMKDGGKPVLHLIKDRENGRNVFKPQYGTDKNTGEKLNNSYQVGNVSVMNGQFETVSKNIDADNNLTLKKPAIRKQKVEIKMPEFRREDSPYGFELGGIAHVPTKTMMNFLDVRGDRKEMYESEDSRKRIDKIKESLIKNGWEDRRGGLYVDVDANGNGWIGEGNHRLIAANELGMEKIPVRVEFGAARDNPNKSIYDESYSKNPTSIISKEKINEFRKEAERKGYHIKNISIWETNLVENTKNETLEIRKQKRNQAKDLGILYKMNIKGFMPITIPLGPLQQSARKLGLRVERAFFREGYNRGQLSGYYFSNGITSNGKPRFYNPRATVRKQQSMSEIGEENKSIIEIVKIGRENNIKDNTIVDYLKRKGGFLMKDIKSVMKLDNYTLENVPESFGNIEGGMNKGILLFDRLYNLKYKLDQNNLTPTGEKITEINEKIEDIESQNEEGVGIEKASTPESIKKDKKDLSALKRKKGKYRVLRNNETRKDKEAWKTGTYSQMPEIVEAIDKLNLEEDATDKEIAVLERKINPNPNTEVDKLKAKLKKVEKNARKENKKFYKFTTQEINNQIIEALEKSKEYQSASNKGAYSTQQAQMMSEMMNAFNGPTMRGDAAVKIKLARQILRERTRGNKELQAVKRDLRNFIRIALPKFVFSKPEVVSLINKITNTSLKNIENLKVEVLEFVNKKTNKELTKQIDKILNGKYDDVQSGRRKGYKVDEITRKRLVSIKGMISGVDSNTDFQEIAVLGQEFEDRITKIEKATVQTPSQRSEIADLNIALDFITAQLSLDTSVEKTVSLQDVSNNLSDLVESGKSILEAEMREKHMEYVDAFQKAFYDITGKKVKVYVSNPDFNELQPETNKNTRLIKNPDHDDNMRDFNMISNAKKRGVVNNAKQSFSQLTDGVVAYVIGNNDLSGLMSKIGKMPGELFGGDLQEMVTFKIDESTNDYKARKMATTIIINDKLMSVYGSKWKAKSLKDSEAKKTNIFLHTGIEINDLSQNQMSYLVNQYKDPANKASFEKKYGKDYIRIMKEMEAKLNKEVAELGRWQIEEFFPSLYEGYNDVYKKVYRTSMPWNEHYAGRIYREGRQDQDIPSILSNAAGAYKGFASPASTKERTANTLAIKDMDQMAAMMTYVNDMNYFAGYAENLNDISKLFSNDDIVNAITSQYGKGPMKSIDHMINKLSNRGVRDEYGMEFINNITTAFVIGRLAINPTILIKQLTSAPAYASVIGYRNWAKHATMGMPDMVSNWKEISENSVYIQDRYGESILRTLETFSPTKIQSLIPTRTMGTIIDGMMYLVKQGDKGAIVIGGVPNYAYYKASFKKTNPTATDQEVIKYAIKKFERDTKRTQQSSDLHDKDQFQTGGAIARGFNMFQTSVKQYLRKEMTTTRNLYRKIKSGGKEGKGTYWENTKTLVMFHAMLPMIFQYISAGLPGFLAPWEDDDDDDLARKAAMGNLNGLYIAGQLFEGLGDFMTEKPWTGDETSLPILNIGMNFFADLNKANQYNITQFDKNGRKRTREDVAESIAGKDAAVKKALYNLANSGLPISQLDRLVKNTDKILKGGLPAEEIILRALQFSDYAITTKEERAAAKKKPVKMKPLTNKELKKYKPDVYRKKMERQNKIKNSDMYRRRKELKEIQRKRREQQLERYYNRN